MIPLTFVDRCGFYCGNYPELTESDIDVICGCLFKVAGVLRPT